MSGGGGDGPGCPLWIVSFADMISNLVIFFILMATFGAKNAANAEQSGGGKDANGGVLEAGMDRRDVVARTPKSGARIGNGARDPSERRETATDSRFDRFAQDASYDVRPGIERLRDGLRIRIDEERLVVPGSWTLSESGKTLVEEIGNFFRGEDCDFTVESHVDSETWKKLGASSDVDASRELAVSVADHLFGNCGIAAPRVSIASFGAAKPVTDNATAVGRARNRRVELVVKERP